MDYSYEFEGTCGEQLLVGRMRVTVTGGEVTGVVPLDDPTQWALDPTAGVDDETCATATAVTPL